MLLRRFTDYIFRSRYHAMMMAFVIGLIPAIGGSISILIAGIVTLRKGAFEGTLVVCAATIPYLINYIGSQSSPGAEVILIATFFIVMINLLTWMLALILRQNGNWNFVIEVAALLGLSVVVIAHIICPDMQAWWAVELKNYFHRTADLMEQMGTGGVTLPPDVESSFIATNKPFATGFAACFVLFNAVLQLILARWWQALMFNPGGLRKELWLIRLSYASVVIFVVVLLLAYLGNQLSQDCEPIVLFAFGTAGLSLMHSLLGPTKLGSLWLSLMYAGVIILFPISIVMLAIAGLFDSLLNFRERLRKSDGSV